MPEIIVQEEVNPEAQAAEDAKIEEAKGLLLAERTGEEPPPVREEPSAEAEPDVSGILEKYGNDPTKLAVAFKSLQAEYTRVRNGGAPTAEPEPTPEPETAAAPPRERIQELVSALQGDDPSRYQAVAQWAVNNISEERKAEYNEALKKGDVPTATRAWKAIQFDHLQATGWEPKLTGGRQQLPDTKPFRSTGEVEAAMSDPRYSPRSNKHDAAYHQDVLNRLAASPGILEQR